MKLTQKLKSWAVKHADVKADASETVFKKAIADALLNDDLSATKFTELSKTEDDEEVSGVKSMLQSLGSSIGKLTEALVADDDNGDKAAKPKTDNTTLNGAGKPSKVDVPVANDEGDSMAEVNSRGEPDADDKHEPPKKSVTTKGNAVPTPLEKMVASMATPGSFHDDGSEKSLSVRVKNAAEQYSSTKSALHFPQVNAQGKPHPFAGRPVKDYTDANAGGHAIDNPSERDKAVAGAYAKFLVATAKFGSKSQALHMLPQHDRELLFYALENEKWGGTTDALSAHGGDENIKHRRLTPNEQKAVIDDGTSGGTEAAPIVFDDMVIQTPLLHGELYPLVNTIPVDRGRRVHAFATANVTSSWGGVDDSNISLFNTAAYVTAFDTTIFRWEGAIVLGLDFLSDTPVDFSQIVTNQYGERLLEDLDDVICTGNGTTQPEGIMTKSGTTSINFGNAAATLGNYELLRFGVSKQEHRSLMAGTAVFCGTETSYQRAKSIPVGASDARRLSNTGNMPSYADYSWMGVPYKIDNAMSNSQIFYAVLGRYRMYRRRGLTMRTSIEGQTLIRGNEMLLSVTARYGGHLERGAVAAVTTTAQA